MTEETLQELYKLARAAHAITDFEVKARALLARQPAAIGKEAVTDAVVLVATKHISDTAVRLQADKEIRTLLAAPLDTGASKCVAKESPKETMERLTRQFNQMSELERAVIGDFIKRAAPSAVEQDERGADKPAIALAWARAREFSIEQWAAVYADRFIEARAASTSANVAQDERIAFESWAASKGHRFNEGDLQHCKTWAWAAWQARAALTSSGRCFFCGEPMDGTHEQDCPQADKSANVAQGAEAVAYAAQFDLDVLATTQESHKMRLRRHSHGTRTVPLYADPPAQTALAEDARKRVAKAIVETYLGFPAPDREPCELDLKAADAAYAALTAAQSASGGTK